MYQRPLKMIIEIALLTGDGCGFVECSQDFWVHVNTQILLLNDSRISSIDPFLDPCGEILFADGVYDIA